jgi:hypothetical protein
MKAPKHEHLGTRPSTRSDDRGGRALTPPPYGLAMFDRGVTPALIHRAAQVGVRTPVTEVPHRSAIERSFGPQVTSQLRAHVGPQASASARAMNADAFASGDHVVFAGTPDVHEVAHEVAHVVQQRRGISLFGGVGRTGDAHEREADAVAARVGAGRSAGSFASLGGSSRASGEASQVQRKVAVTSDNKDTKADYVTLNSIAFGLQIAGGDVEDFQDADFSGLKAGEKIALVGHGSAPGKDPVKDLAHSGNYTGPQIGDALIDDDTGMPDGNHDIVFTSCNAGVRSKESVEDAVVDGVYAKIKGKWNDTTAKVQGATGPSVKTIDDEGLEQWGVVDPTRKLGGRVQTLLNTVYKLKITDTPVFENSPDLSTKATKVQGDQRQYFLDFIALINDDWDSVSQPVKDAIDLDEQLKSDLKGGFSTKSPLRVVG